MNNGHFTAERQEEFLTNFTQAKESVRRYSGTEATYRIMMETMIRYEQWLSKTFAPNELRISEQMEAELSRQMHGEAERVGTISALLSEAQQKLHFVLGSEKGQIIVKQKIKDTLLPAGNGQVVIGGGNGEWREVQYAERLNMLLATLPEHNIHLDDIIVTEGALDAKQMRKCSYILVEIPRLGREILVCDQVGEATFVSARALGINTYIRMPKEELQTVPGVTRIVHISDVQWKADVMDALLQEGEIGPKVNVRDISVFRSTIMNNVPTAEEWVAMKILDKKSLKI